MKLNKVKLGDVLDVKRGTSLAGKYYDESGGKIRLTLGNFNYPRGGFKPNTSKKDIYFNGPVKDEFILQKGDVITPLTEQVRGLLGETARIPKSNTFIQSGDIGLLVPNEEKIDKSFMYHLFSSDLIKEQLSKGAQQTKIRHTSPDKIKNCIAWLPELSIQRKIGTFLDNIDQKIAINNTISKELESMAKTIYDYWFLQFEFPDRDGKPYRSNGGKIIWNDQLKQEIPEGWKVKRLSDIEPNIVTGKTPSTKDRSNFGKDVPFICIGDIRNHCFIDSTALSLSNKGANSQKKKFIPAGSLCVSCIATPGLIGFANKMSQTNQQINSIIFDNDERNKYFLFFALNEYFNNIKSTKIGNTFSNMNKNEFSDILVIYDKNTIIKYFKEVEKYFKKIQLCEMENLQLKSLRDFLLPMLMNGQVTIKD